MVLRVTWFSYYITAIWLNMCVYMWDCVGSMLYVGSMSYNNTHVCVTDRVDFIWLRNRTHRAPKRETTKPILHCYNLVKRHCLELFLLLHKGEWLCGFRLFASAFTPKRFLFQNGTYGSGAENMKFTLSTVICSQSQAISVICVLVLAALESILCWRHRFKTRVSQQFGRCCSDAAVFLDLNNYLDEDCYQSQ